MADDEIVEKCGKTTIRYPVGCAYVCHCDNEDPFHGCWWGVACRGWVTTGTGRVQEPEPEPEHPRPPQVKVAGKLAECARIFEKLLKRPVIVPPKLRGRTIKKRTLRGTPEQVAQALGLELGPKRKRAAAAAKTRRR